MVARGFEHKPADGSLAVIGDPTVDWSPERYYDKRNPTPSDLPMDSRTKGMSIPGVSGKSLKTVMDEVGRTLIIECNSSDELYVRGLKFRFVFKKGEHAYIKPFRLINADIQEDDYLTTSGTDGTLAKPHDKWNYFHIVHRRAVPQVPGSWSMSIREEIDYYQQFLDVFVHMKDLSRRNSDGSEYGNYTHYHHGINNGRRVELAGSGSHTAGRPIGLVQGQVNDNTVFDWILSETAVPRLTQECRDVPHRARSGLGGYFLESGNAYHIWW